MRFYCKLFVFLIICLFALSSYARSGCCSYHGGVSHCDNTVGKYVCRDGTYSPTCLCPKSSKSQDNSSLTEGDKLKNVVVEPKLTTPSGTNKLMSYMGETRSEMDNIKSEIDSLRLELDELKSSFEEIDEIKFNIEDLRSDIARLQSKPNM